MSIIRESHGGFTLDVSKGLSFWEQTGGVNDDLFECVVFDTAGTQYVKYTDLPKVIEYLTKVHEERVIKQNVQMNKCKHCLQVIRDER